MRQWVTLAPNCTVVQPTSSRSASHGPAPLIASQAISPRGSAPPGHHDNSRIADVKPVRSSSLSGGDRYCICSLCRSMADTDLAELRAALQVRQRVRQFVELEHPVDDDRRAVLIDRPQHCLEAIAMADGNAL
jgi:hypothetical protein